MENSSGSTRPLSARYEEVFAHLNEQDIEQFYAHYQLWLLHHRVPILEQQIEILREHAEENQRQMQAMRPSAIAIAVLARLQSKGVSDVDLLDQMLERGEDWLDRMMQRLDYCEQVEDFIRGDYTQWCINSLDGAYDWIDTVRSSPPEETDKRPAIESPDEAETQATAELLLQKLSTDDEESMLGVTLKLPVLKEKKQEEDTISELDLATAEAFLHSPPDLETELVEIDDELALSANTAAAYHNDDEDASQAALSESAEAPVDSAASSWDAQEADTTFTFAEPIVMNDWIKFLETDSSAADEDDTTEIALAHPAEAVQADVPDLISEEEAALAPLEEIALPSPEPAEPPTSQADEVPASEAVLSPLSDETETGEPLPPEEEPDEAAASLDLVPPSTEATVSAEAASSAPPELEITDETRATQQEEISAAEVPSGSLAEEIDASISNELYEAEEVLPGEPEADAEAETAAQKLVAEIEELVQAAEQIGTATDEHPEDEAELPASATSTELLAPPQEETAILQAEVASEPQKETLQAESGEPPAAHEEPAILQAEVASEPQEATLQAEPGDPPAAHEFEEAALINSILEPEEGELAWYDYLEMERLSSTSSAAAGSHVELEEIHVEHTDDTSEAALAESAMARSPLQTVDAEIVQTAEDQAASATEQETDNLSSDETAITLPMALKEIQQAPSEPATNEIVAEATPLEPSVDSSEIVESTPAASDTEQIASAESGEPALSELANEQAATAGVQESATQAGTSEAAPSGSVLPLTSALDEPEKQAEIPPVQSKPPKRSFWQWLFRRKSPDAQ